MVDQRAAKQQMDASARVPVTENPDGDVMAPMNEVRGPAGRRGGKGAQMAPAAADGDEVEEATPETSEYGADLQGERMEPAATARMPTPHGGRDRPDQEPPAEAEGSYAGRTNGYTCLRVGGKPGAWRVLGHRHVPGPLAEPKRLSHGWAWEVRYGERRLSLGQIPEMGETRGFPDPEGHPGMEGHHIGAPPDAEFVVRVPEDVLGDAPLEELEIRLYRIDEPPAEDVGPEPLDQQFRTGVRLMSEEAQ